MKKNEAIELFGSVKSLAEALGITRQAIYKLPDDLPFAHADRINGAALRLGLHKVSGDDKQTA